MKRDPKSLDGLDQFCTIRQLEVLEAVRNNDSGRTAALALGITERNVFDTLERIKKKGAACGWAPGQQWTNPVPAPHIASGVSTLYDENGVKKIQWVKSALKQEAYNELIKGAIREFMEDVPPLPVVAAPLDYQSDIIPWIQIGDAHIGMLAHAAETTENFDLKIAERELCGAIAILIDEMPACERLVINDLGDATHYSNMKGETNASGHVLDYDGRFPKMIRVYSRIMRFIVDRALTKAKSVDVLINQGNHSEENDIWMAELLRVAYGHTGRVTVLDNDSVFIPYRMGNTLVMVHHSHKCPPARLVGVLTSDFRKDYGETEHHFIDTGHVHHHFVSKEHPGVLIESWNHLAPNDRWGHESGYRARKAITVALRSKTYGDVGRRVLCIQEIRDRMANAYGAAPAKERKVHTV